MLKNERDLEGIKSRIAFYKWEIRYQEQILANERNEIILPLIQQRIYFFKKNINLLEKDLKAV